MKKSLLMILSAALLFVGCTKELEQKVTDLTSRVDQIETMVKANDAAIKALQSSTDITITNVQDIANVGWTVTLSSGKTLVLYGGTSNAKLIKSVEKTDTEVTFTLADGSTIVIPMGSAQFELVLELNEVLAVPGETLVVPFSVTGKTAKTEVNAMGNGYYVANISEDGNSVEIIIPELPEGVTTIPEGRVMVFADNGEGKTSIKAIEICGPDVREAKIAAYAYYWGGTSCTLTVPSNVDITAEVDPECRVFASIDKAQTKAALTDHKVVVNFTASPLCNDRIAGITIYDPLGNAVQRAEAVQKGTNGSFYVEETGKFYWNGIADAIKEVEAAGKTSFHISFSESSNNGLTWEYVVIPENTIIKEWLIDAREYGSVPAANPQRTTFRGVFVMSPDANVTIKNVRFLADCATSPVGEGQFSKNNCALYVHSACKGNIVLDNVYFFPYTAMVTKNATQIAVQAGSQANVTFTNCNIAGAPWTFGGDGKPYIEAPVVNPEEGILLAQLYGGNVTFDGCQIIGGYSSYAMCVGCTANATFKNNTIDSKVFVNAHSSCTAASITFGDGKVDDNGYTKNVETILKNEATAGTVTIAPETQGANGNVMRGDIAYSTISGAIAGAVEGDVITVKAGEFNENVKIANGKNVKIIGAGKESTVVNGSIEIAGSADITGITVKSKNGITEDDLTVAVSGDNYKWGYPYVVRIENGASNVYVHDCNIRGIEAGTYNSGASAFKDGMSVLFIAQATDVRLENVEIEGAEDASYCCNQTYDAEVAFKNVTFIGGGKKHYASRVAANTDASFDGCTFNIPQKDGTAIAIDVLDGFNGSLTLGDGTADNNVYGEQITKAVNGNKTSALAAGATFAPANMVFNAPTTAPVPFENFELTEIKTSLCSELGIADPVRTAGYDGKNIYCVMQPTISTTDGTMTVNPAIYKVTPEGVATALDFASGALDGFGSYSGGAIKAIGGGVVYATPAGPGNQWAWGNGDVNVFFYDGTNPVKKAFTITVPNADPSNTKLGGEQWTRAADYIDYVGSWTAGILYAATCDAAKTERTLMVAPVTNGQVGSVSYIPFTGTAITDNVLGASVIGNAVVLTSQTQNCEVYKYEGGALTLLGNFPAIAKCPTVFEYKGTQFVAYAVEDASPVVKVHVGELEGTDIAAALAAYDASNELVYTINATVANGNHFVTLQAAEADGYYGLAVNIMKNGVSLLKLAEKAE